jgi:UDP-N-acetylmuramate: L-alanyl-gamma-D-glutamyl-meso-diaminopimelate ligase
VRDVTRAGRHARSIPAVDDIVQTIAREAADGDLVVVMSNGGFEGIHEKLLAALGRLAV